MARVTTKVKAKPVKPPKKIVKKIAPKKPTLTKPKAKSLGDTVLAIRAIKRGPIGKGKALTSIRHPKPKAKPKPKKRAKDSLTIDDVVHRIVHTKDCYAMNVSEPLVFFVKKITISVNRINDNSIFQPHEHVEKKSYFIGAYVELSNHKAGFWDGSSWGDFYRLAASDCPMFTVSSLDDIDRAIEGLE